MDEKKVELTVDRGLAKGVSRVHGLNPVLLIEKILRERIQDSYYWLAQACNMSFWDVLRAACLKLPLVGTYINGAKTRVASFMALLLRLLQLPAINDEIVEWLIVGNHKHKYATVLFMVYGRLIWEDSKSIYLLLERKLDDYRKIKVFDGSEFTISTVDQIADDLLNKNKFFDMALPKLVNRWVLEDTLILEERDSKLADEFEQQIEDEDEDAEK